MKVKNEEQFKDLRHFLTLLVWSIWFGTWCVFSFGLFHLDMNNLSAKKIWSSLRKEKNQTDK